MINRKIITLILLLITSLTLFACDNGEDDLVDEDGKPIINIFMNSGNTFEGRKKDSIWLKIEEEANVSLRIKGATHNSDYYQTLNPMINTGNILDVVFTVPSSSNKAYTNWVQQDVFWNIDELIAEKPGEYPYIEALLASEQYRNITYGDGAHTMIPYINSKNSWGIYYRTDWLVNVGYINEDGSAKIPTNIEEFTEVLRLFSTADPDKNGKNDTWGLSPNGETYMLNPLYHAFGVTPDYDIDSKGNINYMYLTDEFKDFLTWMNDMYNNGYIDPQFATNKNNADREKFYEGKVGILITNAELHVTYVSSSFESANGVGKLTLGPAPVGTANLGKEGFGGFSDWGGWWGGYSISKTCADPHAALRLFNYLYSPEGNMLRCYGIEGIHYELVNDEVVPLIEGRNNEPDETFNMSTQENGTVAPTGYYKFGSTFSGYFEWNENLTEITHKIIPSLVDVKYKDLIQLGIDNMKLASGSLVNLTGYYPSYATKMSKIEDETNTYAIQVIMGIKNLSSDYDLLLETINSKSYDWQGVKKMIDEVARNAGLI